MSGRARAGRAARTTQVLPIRRLHRSAEAPRASRSPYRFGAAPNLGRDVVEPAIALEEQVEVEEVVRLEGRSDARLGELGRQSPHLHAHAARHEQIDDAPACFLGDRPLAIGATEAVRPALVIGADANRQILGGELHITAAWAVGPDRGHRVTRPWSAPTVAKPRLAGGPYT